MRPQMEVKNLGGRRGEVLIYDEIGQSFWGDGLTAKSFTRQIDELDVDELTVRVNSPGGDAFDGIAIMNALKRHPARVTTIVDGLAASAASIIAVGGADRVVMAEGAQLMIHDAWSWSVGNAAALRKAGDDLDKLSQELAEIYARVAGTPVEEWRAAMREETWFTAKEAVACGLAHAVEGAESLADVQAFAQGRVFAMFKHDGRQSAPVPSILSRLGASASVNTPAGEEGETVGFLNDIAARLGVADTEVSEVTVMAALEEALAEQAEEQPVTVNVSGAALRVEEAEKTLQQVSENVSGLDLAVTRLDAARDAAPDEEDTEDVDDGTDEEDTVVLDKAVYEDLLERATRGDQAADEQKEERAAALIEEHGIKAGRLLGWQRDAWVEKAVENYDATEKALMRLAPGVNLAPKGRAGSDEQRDAASKDALNAAMDRTGNLPTK